METIGGERRKKRRQNYSEFGTAQIYRLHWSLFGSMVLFHRSILHLRMPQRGVSLPFTQSPSPLRIRQNNMAFVGKSWWLSSSKLREIQDIMVWEKRVTSCHQDRLDYYHFLHTVEPSGLSHSTWKTSASVWEAPLPCVTAHWANLDGYRSVWALLRTYPRFTHSLCIPLRFKVGTDGTSLCWNSFEPGVTASIQVDHHGSSTWANVRTLRILWSSAETYGKMMSLERVARHIQRNHHSRRPLG